MSYAQTLGKYSQRKCWTDATAFVVLLDYVTHCNAMRMVPEIDHFESYLRNRYAPTENDWQSSTGSNITFSYGIMRVDGRSQRPIAVVNWAASSAGKQYTCTHWQDPMTGEHRTSCNCRGWTVKKKNRDRECCHTKDMEGRQECAKQRLSSYAINTPAEAAAVIPNVEDNRELRAIWLS